MKKFLVLFLFSWVATAIVAQNKPSADKLRQNRILDIVRPNQKTVSGFLNADLRISMQERVKSGWIDGEDAQMTVGRTESWKPSETALIICDMWDKHWCDKSSVRFGELAIALNGVADKARNRGVKIVHAPGECMDYYKDYPQRREAKRYKNAKLAALANGDKLPAEKNAMYPVPRPDEGCENKDCKPLRTWTKQNDALSIKTNDLISDSGEELGAYFKKKGIRNVIMTGAVTDVYAMERSAGLRAMKRMGMNVVLMRDMIDMMCSSEVTPFIDHYSGLDLMTEYIETYVCPSIVSSAFTGTKQFRFPDDRRKRIAFLVAAGNEDHSSCRLPEFARDLTLKNFHCDFALCVPRTENEESHVPENLQILEDAGLTVLSIHHRDLEPETMNMIKRYAASGRPILGTGASAAAFDVCGESDRGHYGQQKEGTDVNPVPGMENHPLLKDVKPFNSPDRLYRCAPLRSDRARVLLTGSNPGNPPEPVFWLDEDNIIYTSLGYPYDWKIESFRNLMFNSVDYLLK
jgi:nicotinamidase-related amidase